MKKLILVVLVLGLATAVQAELLLNRSFDSLDGLGNPDSANWGTWGNASNLLSNNPDPANSGPAYVEIWGWDGSSGGVYQDVVPTVGAAYNLSVMARDQGWGADKSLNFTLQVSSDGGANWTLLVNDLVYTGAGLGDSNYHLFSTISPAIPVGTNLAEFGFTFASSAGSADGGTFAFDDASMAVVPEPMTIGLLSLGGLFLRRRKA